MFVQTQQKSHIDFQLQLREYAKKMRKFPTPAEKRMWDTLRKHPFKLFHFRRQHPLYVYIADFYSRELHLIIELDGLIHEHQIPHDLNRDQYLRERGLHILRINNELVLNQMNDVLKLLHQTINGKIK